MRLKYIIPVIFIFLLIAGLNITSADEPQYPSALDRKIETLMSLDGAEHQVIGDGVKFTVGEGENLSHLYVDCRDDGTVTNINYSIHFDCKSSKKKALARAEKDLNELNMKLAKADISSEFKESYKLPKSFRNRFLATEWETIQNKRGVVKHFKLTKHKAYPAYVSFNVSDRGSTEPKLDGCINLQISRLLN